MAPVAPAGEAGRIVRTTGERATLNVALLGCGVVGSAVYRLLTEQSADLAARAGARLEVVGVAVRDTSRPRAGHRRARRAAHDRCPGAGHPSRCRHRHRADRRHRARPRPAAGRAQGRASRWSRRTRRCWPPTGRRCTRRPGEAGLTSTTRPPWPGRSRCCARCASRWPATRSAGCSASSTGRPTYILDQMDTSGADFGSALAEAQELGYAEADPTADVAGLRRGGQGRDPGQHRLPHRGHRR